MKYLVLSCLILVAMVAGAATTADVPIVGADASVTLQDIVGTPTLISVVLRDSNARDPNLRLSEVHVDRIVVTTQNGDAIPYLVDSIEQIEIQGDSVEPRRFPELDAQVLRAEHQRVVDRAWSRIQEIYADSDDNQRVKMRAATLLALAQNTDAHNYLRQLAETNDIIVQLDAAGALYLMGDLVSETLLRQGLDSGNRSARTAAASLSGLTNYRDGIPFLHVMFQDRAAQLSAPATRALARMGEKDIVPRLLSMIMELHATKGEAAIFALTKLADEQVIDQLKFRLLEAEGMMRLRLVRVLYNYGDPSAMDELKHLYQTYPTLAPEVALVLARDGDWEATQFLRARLARREDPTPDNLRYRAQNAQALLAGGDPSAMAVFQELLRSGDDDITRVVFELMLELGYPRLITLLQPSIENVDHEFALNACQTVIAIALTPFRERLMLYREEFDE